MKLSLLASAVLVVAAPLAMAQTSTWKTDPAHSEVDFSIKHMALSNVHGRFGTVDATLTWDDADPAKSTVNATIDVTGVDTGVPNRDTDLKSARFFDVANHPKATFTSTSVEKSGSGYKVNGNLTIKGVSKPVTLEVDAPDRSGEGHAQHDASRLLCDHDGEPRGFWRGRGNAGGDAGR